MPVGRRQSKRRQLDTIISEEEDSDVDVMTDPKDTIFSDDPGLSHNASVCQPPENMEEERSRKEAVSTVNTMDQNMNRLTENMIVMQSVFGDSLSAINTAVSSMQATLNTVVNRMVPASASNQDSRTSRRKGTSSQRQSRSSIRRSSDESSSSSSDYEAGDSPSRETTDAVTDSNNINSQILYGSTQSRKNSSTKLPPFTDKDTWKTWFSRFETVADRCRWSNGERLDQLLPRLQGKAGDFVFDQLTKRDRNNYNTLVKELNNRYRVIESSKTYAAQFSRRNQKHGESVEEYAAELKRLYDKAHKRRGSHTRSEDLLRGFFDGVYHEKASFEVEFHKDPKNIDEAVFHVVNYVETKRSPNQEPARNSRKTRKVQDRQDFDSSDDDNYEDTGRNKNHNSVRNVEADKAKKGKPKQIIKPDQKRDSNKTPKPDTSKNAKDQKSPEVDAMIEIMEKTCQEFRNRMSKKSSGSDDRRCYFCDEPGHFARNCPNQRNQSFQYNQYDQRHEGPVQLWQQDRSNFRQDV